MLLGLLIADGLMMVLPLMLTPRRGGADDRRLHDSARVLEPSGQELHPPPEGTSSSARCDGASSSSVVDCYHRVLSSLLASSFPPRHRPPPPSCPPPPLRDVPSRRCTAARRAPTLVPPRRSSGSASGRALRSVRSSPVGGRSSASNSRRNRTRFVRDLRRRPSPVRSRRYLRHRRSSSSPTVRQGRRSWRVSPA